MTIAKHCSPPGSCSVKSPIGLRVIAIEEAVIQALTISAPLSTKNGLVETVQQKRWRPEVLPTKTGGSPEEANRPYKY